MTVANVMMLDSHFYVKHLYIGCWLLQPGYYNEVSELVPDGPSFSCRELDA